MVFWGLSDLMKFLLSYIVVYCICIIVFNFAQHTKAVVVDTWMKSWCTQRCFKANVMKNRKGNFSKVDFRALLFHETGVEVDE